MDTLLLILVVALAVGLAPLWAAFVYNACGRRYQRRKRQAEVGYPAARWQLGDFLASYPNTPSQMARDAAFERLRDAPDEFNRRRNEGKFLKQAKEDRELAARLAKYLSPCRCPAPAPPGQS